MKAPIFATFLLLTMAAFLTGCPGWFPLERPGYDPAGDVSEHGRAWVWSEGYNDLGTDVNRITHGAVFVDGTMGYEPDADLADGPTRLDISGPNIGYRTLTYLGGVGDDRYFLTWQNGDGEILGEFRSGADLSRIPGSETIFLVSGRLDPFAPNLTSPKTVDRFETVVEGQQYDIAYNEAANKLLLVWRVFLIDRRGHRIAHRLIDARTGELGSIQTSEGSPTSKDSWPQVAASVGLGAEQWDFCVTYTHDNGRGRFSAYAYLVKADGETYRHFDITADDDSDRSDSQLRTAVTWGGPGFTIAYDSNLGIRRRQLIPLRNAEDSPIGQAVSVSPPRQDGRDSPILLDYNEATNEYALAYYEKEEPPCYCSTAADLAPACAGEECHCEGITLTRNVLFAQKLSADASPEVGVGGIQRARIYPPASSIYRVETTPESCDVPSETGAILMHWNAAGRAVLTARETARLLVEEHTFEVHEQTDRNVFRWKPELLKLKARVYPRIRTGS